MSRLRELLLHPWLLIRLQILLGVLFIAAALPKIVDPPSFAHMVHNYKLIPASLNSAFALVMPWIELMCGVALCLGIWKRTAAIFVSGLLFVFIVAISINLVRDNAVNCGCFDVSSASKTHAELIGEMWWVVIRDVLLMVASGLVLAGTRVDVERRVDL